MTSGNQRTVILERGKANKISQLTAWIEFPGCGAGGETKWSLAVWLNEEDRFRNPERLSQQVIIEPNITEERVHGGLALEIRRGPPSDVPGITQCMCARKPPKRKKETPKRRRGKNLWNLFRTRNSLCSHQKKKEEL